MEFENVEVNSKRWLDLKDLKNEEWQDIKDYEGLYQVSNYGRIKSLPKFHKTNKNYSSIGYITKSKILKQYMNHTGYYSVQIKGKKHVHKLVLENFVENVNNLPCINHRDENKENNKLYNLEYCTYKYNTNYGTTPKRISETKRKKYGRKTNQYDLQGNFLKTWNNAREIDQELNIAWQNVWKCCNGKRKTAGGFIWKYAE